MQLAILDGATDPATPLANVRVMHRDSFLASLPSFFNALLREELRESPMDSHLLSDEEAVKGVIKAAKDNVALPVQLQAMKSLANPSPHVGMPLVKRVLSLRCQVTLDPPSHSQHHPPSSLENRSQGSRNA